MKYLSLTLILIAATLHESTRASQYSVQEARSGEELGLSSWELYVINDLLFQITVKKCPKINRPAATSLKDYITGTVQMAAQNDAQHSEFMATYTNLLGCFDNLDKASSNPGKKLPSVQFIKPNDAEKQSDESWLSPSGSEEMRKAKSVQSTEAPRLNYAWEDQAGQWHWEWMSKVANLFSDVFRQKRDTEDEKPKIKKHSDNKPLKKFSDAKNNLINMLHEMNRVLRASCPAEFTPDGSFTRKALLEIVNWASMDSRSLVRTSSKYFDEDSLLEQVHECLQTL